MVFNSCLGPLVPSALARTLLEVGISDWICVALWRLQTRATLRFVAVTVFCGTQDAPDGDGVFVILVSFSGATC